MTREELDFIWAMNMDDEISNEAYRKIMCHYEEQDPCEDCISRHAAKRIIFDEFEGWPTDEEVARLKRLTRQFDNLPSVTPQEPKTQFVEKSNFDIMQYNNDLQSAYDCGKASQESKTGHWLEHNDSHYNWIECSECRYGADGEITSEHGIRFRYCPMCGAKMEE